MNHLNTDLLVNIISYLNVIDGIRFSMTCQRMFYLINEFPKIIGPQVVGEKSYDDHEEAEEEQSQRTKAQTMEHAMSKMRTKPDIAFFFQKSYLGADCRRNGVLPPSTIVLGAASPFIQSNIPHRPPQADDMNISLLLGSFPRESTRIVPFVFDGMLSTDTLEKFAADEFSPPVGYENDEDYWKVFVVYVCGYRQQRVQAEPFIQQLQSLYPNAAIVGGICDSGYVSVLKKEQQQQQERRKSPRLAEKNGSVTKPMYEVQEVGAGIFGVAMGGDIPIQSIVSRGVKSLLQSPDKMDASSETSSSSPSSSPWIIHSSFLAKPTDENNYPLRGVSPDTQTPVHIIHKFKNTQTNAIVSPIDLIYGSHEFGNEEPEFLGICRRSKGEDGFQLIERFGVHGSKLIIMTDGSASQNESLTDAEVNFFSLDGEECCADMEDTVHKLYETSISNSDVLLGAIMFSCNGRGPHKSGFINEEQADAKRFHQKFPNIPCCGFYAGGEIGPLALVGNENVFQRGKAALQGFTAVFAVFVVPKNRIHYHLDDSHDNVKQYVKDKLASWKSAC